MLYTFKGGTQVAEHKHTKNSPIEKMNGPEEIFIPMSQHIGEHCTPIVKAGDRVLRGQIIGEIENGLGCPVHSSVSGVVKEIVSYNDAQARPIKTVVIQNDGQNELDPSIKPINKKLTETTTEEIIDIIRAAGISGMGGASFPTYAKIQSALGRVNRLIINCAECEPYITANHRLMLERPNEIINGTKILLKAFGLREADIAVEDNKLDAADVLEQKIGKSRMIKVKIMKTKYPQGDERQLVFALTGREIPHGKLPADVGCVIFNAETCAAIYRAFAFGMPLIERIVTVAGDCVATPKNVLCPIGTTYRQLFDFCGGMKKEPKKIISGGPMMGFAAWDMDSPVVKGTSAVLAFSADMCVEENEYACIRCGRCVKNCPMHLMPNYLAQFIKAGRHDDAEKYDVMCCVECGTCSYNCPGNVPIVQYIRASKGAIKAKNAVKSKNAMANMPEIDKK